MFGGIIRCDMIAKGIIAAATEMILHVPLVVRLQGMYALVHSQYMYYTVYMYMYVICASVTV